MIVKLWNDLITALKSFLGTGSLLVLFVVALAFIASEKNRKAEGDEPDVWMYVLSVWGTISVAIIHFLELIFEKGRNSGKQKWVARAIAVAFCFFIIAISGKRILSPVFYVKAENEMHIPSDLVSVMDTILADSPQGAKILTVPGYGCYYSTYDSRLVPIYDEPIGGDVADYPEKLREAYRQLEDKNADMTVVARAAREYDCKYIILKSNTYWPKVPLTELGFDMMGSAGEWELYRQTEVNNDN